MLNPTPKSPRLLTGSLLEYPARAAFCIWSMVIPTPLSMTSIVLLLAATLSPDQVTVTVFSVRGILVRSASAKASTALSINSARHCHGWKGISPNVRSIRGVGVMSMLPLTIGVDCSLLY